MSTETTAPAETTPERCAGCGDVRHPDTSSVWVTITDTNTYGVRASFCYHCAARRLVPRCANCGRHHTEGDEREGWAVPHPYKPRWEWYPGALGPDTTRALCPECLELPARELLNVFK